MTASNLIEGLKIIEAYRPKEESGYHIRAEHDVFYAGSLDWAIPDHEVDKLEKLGWAKDEDVDGWRALV
jgi:hypothetical protein